jgi:hypothetical protein
MHDLMVGMFWGGLVMALPPVILGIVIGVLVLRHMRNERANPTGRAGDR